MGKVYTRFQAKRLKTRAFWAAHTYMANLREYPPLPGCYSYERLEGSSKFLLSLFSGEETFKDDEFTDSVLYKVGSMVYRTLERERVEENSACSRKKKLIRNDISGEEIMMGP